MKAFHFALIIAIWWWLTETAYFGWNATPQSSAELIADGVALLMLLVSLLIRAVEENAVTIRVHHHD